MKTIALFLGFIWFGTLLTNAQNDSTVYINGIPVTESDTVTNFPDTDLFPKTNHERIHYDKIPSKLRKILERKSLYKGWNQTGVFLDKNTNLYLVRVSVKKGYKIFGLDKNGNPVTFDEVSEKENK